MTYFRYDLGGGDVLLLRFDPTGENYREWVVTLGAFLRAVQHQRLVPEALRALREALVPLLVRLERADGTVMEIQNEADVLRLYVRYGTAIESAVSALIDEHIRQGKELRAWLQQNPFPKTQ